MNEQAKEVITELEKLDRELVAFVEKIDKHAQWLNDNDSPLISQIGNLISTNQSFINFTDQENLDDWQTRTIAKLQEMSVQFTFTELGSPPSCWDNVKLALPETLNELCSNSIRHGKATSIELLCLHTPDATIITLTDNGKGFDFETKETGLGLKTLLQGEKIAGSTITYNALDTGGTVCSITISHEVFAKTFTPPEEQETDWAKNLHDSICPEVLGIFLISQQLLNQIPESESDLWYQVKLLTEYCQKSFDHLRKISHSLDSE